MGLKERPCWVALARNQYVIMPMLELSQRARAFWCSGLRVAMAGRSSRQARVGWEFQRMVSDTWRGEGAWRCLSPGTASPRGSGSLSASRLSRVESCPRSIQWELSSGCGPFACSASTIFAGAVDYSCRFTSTLLRC